MVFISKAPYIQGIPGGGLQHEVLNLRKHRNPPRIVPRHPYYAERYAEALKQKDAQRDNFNWVLLWFIFLILIV